MVGFKVHVCAKITQKDSFFLFVLIASKLTGQKGFGSMVVPEPGPPQECSFLPSADAISEKGHPNKDWALCKI